MEIFTRIDALRQYLDAHKETGGPISFVPTMGALHKGHLSLIEQAKLNGGLVICSIFVNPTQFTDPKDLEKYPRPLEHDINLLNTVGCNAVFMPSVEEMYPLWPEKEEWHIDLGETEFLLEGAFRKGHYQGVTQIVKKLFDAVQPNFAYFGQKDYQQILMIEKMVSFFQLNIEIVSCPIIREEDGLAMSSRNIHLTERDRKSALILFAALNFVKANYGKLTPSALISEASKMVNTEIGVELEYLSIADRKTLIPVKDDYKGKAVALIAAKVGNTRLIDNVLLD
ncbi:pantoate--beta-alanine ligase [Pedobacter flavus]|uniref:Pantothenate synthetase n=1 Tax=Pedobacter flavus TaxID=3113906 RepID=A0ABU7GZ65_9SPHI|nr:pantoate--beta-alanine ligase [Pedobacter sp. VNH31]MEE1884309.1 pantoate--beta-alanine ligase [Pedobacter sp. VNH31]